MDNHMELLQPHRHEQRLTRDAKSLEKIVHARIQLDASGQ